MMLRSPIIRAGAGLVFVLVLAGASLPRAITAPGEWEVAKAAGSRGERLCLSDPAILLQWEHRNRQCTRAIVTSSVERAEVHYRCIGGGFGTSRVEVLTPRAIRVKTQGIADGLPFAYVLHARRVGACAAR